MGERKPEFYILTNGGNDTDISPDVNKNDITT